MAPLRDELSVISSIRKERLGCVDVAERLRRLIRNQLGFPAQVRILLSTFCFFRESLRRCAEQKCTVEKACRRGRAVKAIDLKSVGVPRAGSSPAVDVFFPCEGSCCAFMEQSEPREL